jgi:hypothetical protein
MSLFWSYMGSSTARKSAMSEPDEYTVGYRKPPKNNQFQKGRSGNPGGKRKAVVTNAHSALASVLSRRVTVADEDGETRMSELQALMRGLVNKARQGDTRCIKLVLERLESIEDDETAQQELETRCQKAARDEAKGQHVDESSPEPPPEN